MRRDVLISILLFFVTLAVFCRALGHDFVQWDDDISIYRNPHIQGLDAQRLSWMFTDVESTMRYRPLTWLSFALIHAVGGLNPFGYHFVSLLFHSLTAVLLFIVLWCLLEAGLEGSKAKPKETLVSLCAGLAALLWAVHPLRVEPVAWATDLTYCQSLFLTLVSLWCYLRAVRVTKVGTGGRRWYWCAVIAFALAMLSHPVVFGYAAVLVVLDFYPLRRFNSCKGWWRDGVARRIWLEKVPFVVLAGLILVTFVGRLNPTGIWFHQNVHQQLGVFGHTMQAFYIWTYYLWRPWMPFNLSPVYTALVQFNPMDTPFIMSAIAVIGLTVLFVWNRRRWPLALALWICHLVLLLPALGVTEHPHYASDRYGYVPGLLWSVLLAAGLLKLCRQPKAFTWAVAALIVLVTFLGSMSFRQTRIWRNSVTLFEYMIANLGDNPYRADIYMRLASLYSDRGEFSKAVEVLRTVTHLYPNYAKAHSDLGDRLLLAGDLDAARASYEQALRLDPKLIFALNNLGIAYARQGKLDQAVAQFAEILRRQADNRRALKNMAIVLRMQGKTNEASIYSAKLKEMQYPPALQHGD